MTTEGDDPRGQKAEPAAKEGDRVIGVDMHLVEGKPMPFPFEGKLDEALSPDVLFEDKPAATVDTVAHNERTHVPPPSKAFDKPPKNEGVVIEGSATVFVNDRPVARNGHKVETCDV